MNESILTDSDETGMITNHRLQGLKTIFYAGLAVGILDGIFALVYYGLILGAAAGRIFQTIASGILGKASYEGGATTVWLGILFHFVVATCISAFYYVVSLKLTFVNRYAVICGLIYGVIAYLGMNYIVIPLSAASSGKFSLPVFLTALIAHVFLVGLPIALITRRFAKKENAKLFAT